MNVYIMSGPPGSGKSTEAKNLALDLHRDGEKGLIISADHCWSESLLNLIGNPYTGIPFSSIEDPNVIDALKEYNFDVKELSKAHQFCFLGFINALVMRTQNVIVDNTNIHNYEIAPYYLAGESLTANVEILRVKTALTDCLARNTHSVPEDTVKRMHGTFSKESQHPWEPKMIPEQHLPWWKSSNV